MSWRILTAALLVAFAVILIAYDVVAEIKGGNASTISQVLYNAALAEPVIPLAIGILMGHLFWPQAK